MKHKLAAVAIVLVLAGVVWAGVNQESYATLGKSTTVGEIDTDNSGDTLTVGSAPTTGRYKRTYGNPTIYVRIDLSGSAGDTCLVYCRLWRETSSGWEHLGDFQATAVAGSAVDAAGDQVPEQILLFDSGSATHYEPLVAAPSAGTADIAAWSGGSQPQ